MAASLHTPLCLAVAAAIVALAAAPVVAAEITPAPEHIAPWTFDLAGSQPREAFAAVYRNGAKRLVVIGALHTIAIASSTFRLIDAAYGAFRFDSVIVEGFPYSAGPNAADLLRQVTPHRVADGIEPGGERVAAVRGGVAQGATVWGGELNDRQILSYGVNAGMEKRDLVGFYALRAVPGWLRRKDIADTADPALRRLIEQEIVRDRSRLGLPAAVMSGYDDWLQWYGATNRKPSLQQFSPDETAPLADGKFVSNRIAIGIDRLRNSFLLAVMARHVNRSQNVLIVFGAGHLMVLRPALSHMLGEPCYFGSGMAAAATACR